MKEKKFLVIDDDWINRKISYEALRVNLEERLNKKYSISFQYLECWSDFGDTVLPEDFNAIISDFFLESAENLESWPKSISVKDVLKRLSPNTDIPIFVVSSQWDAGEGSILDETFQNNNVESLLLWSSIEAEKRRKSYASLIIYNKIFSKSKFVKLEDNTKISILHFSDFHYGSKENDAYALKKRLILLYNKLDSELDLKNGNSLHFMCMGGDFVDKGDIGKYDDFSNIFKDFLKKFEKQPIPITILTVPGNHDYDLETAKLSLKCDLLKESTLYPYYKFSSKISQDMKNITHSPNKMWILNSVAEYGFYFYGINTELNCDNIYESKISDDDLIELENNYTYTLSKFSIDNIVPICLTHRTIDSNMQFFQDEENSQSKLKFIKNFQSIKNIFENKGISSIFLCGDIHANTPNTVCGGRVVNIISSAPPFMGETKNTFGQGFNIIHLTREHGEVTKVEVDIFSYIKENNSYEKRKEYCTTFEKKNKQFNPIQML